MAIGNNIKKIRESNGYSQEVIAEELGVSRQAISKWENGISEPSTENLLKLSKLYEIDIEVLIDNEISVTKKSQKKSTYFKSYADKMRVVAFFGRVSIVVALTGYYGYYSLSEDASIVQWLLVFLIGCGLIFYGNKEFDSNNNPSKKLIVADLLLIFTTVFIPRIINISKSLDILIMNLVAVLIISYIMKLMRDRWTV